MTALLHSGIHAIFLPVGQKPVRNLHSASTIVIGEQSNMNLNNNNGPSNSTPNVSDDDKIANSSRVEIGHMVSMVASETDSVFIRNPNETVDTHTQESIIETPASAHDVQLLGEGANQQPHETAEPQQEEVGDEATPEQPAADGATVQEENAARPPSSMSRKEIDECNSLSQLPKVIVRKSINGAIKRLSLHKDDEAETSGNAKEEQPEVAVPQDGQVNQPSQQEEAEGECMKETQPEVPNEDQPTVAEKVKDANDGAVITESQKVKEDATTKPQEIETAEAPAATTSQSEEGGTTEEVHVSSTTTNTAAANEDSTSSQEPPVVGATNNSGAAVEENRPEGDAVTDQEAAASNSNVPENNKDDPAGGAGTAEPTQAEEKGDSGKGDDGSSETPKEILPSGSSDESATPPDVQETQNEQQQEDNNTPQ